MWIEDYFRKLYKKLLEKASSISTLFLHPQLIDKNNPHNLLEVGHFHKGVETVLEELSPPNFNIMFLLMLVLLDICFDRLLK